MRRFARLAFASLLAAALAAPAFAAPEARPDPAQAAPAAGAEGKPDPARMPAPAAQAADADAAAAAAARAGVDVRLFNRVVTTFRAPIFDSTPAERAESAERHLRELLREAGEGKVEVKKVALGRALTLDNK